MSDLPSLRKAVGRPRGNGMPASSHTRTQILEAAANLFASKGFRGTSTHDIAELVGIRQPTLFHYFPTKEALLETILLTGMEKLLDRFTKIESAPGTPATKLMSLIEADVTSLAGADMRLRRMLILPEIGLPFYATARAGREQLIASFKRVLRDGVQQGFFKSINPAMVARQIVALGESMIDIGVDEKPADPEVYAKSVTRLLFDALLTPKGRATLSEPDWLVVDQAS